MTIMTSMKRALATFLIFATVSPLSAVAAWYRADAPIMGTNIQVELWADSEATGNKATSAVLAEMERINQAMSPYIATSELSRLNARAANEAVKVSQELFDLVALSVSFSEQTQGAFDITFASVGFLYDYRQRIKPDATAISELLDSISYRHLQLDAVGRTIHYANKDVKVDLGGIAKGHAVDNAVTILKGMGIEHALVTAGGDTKLLGDRRGRPWIVGIRDPRNGERQAVVLPLENTALSTSGDYERYFENDGVRYHHILSPKTGTSAKNVQSVSIMGPSSTQNDALSTAVFVLGLERGIALINRIPEVDAIVMDNNRKLHYSNGLQE